VTVVVAVVMLLVLVLVVCLDSAFTGLSEWGFWRDFLDAPVLIIYILVVYTFIWRLWWQSVQALQSLLPVDEGDSNRLEVEVPIPNRRREWVAILTGAVFWLSLWQPWAWDGRWEPGAIWLSVYDAVTQSILFGLLSLLIYSSFAGSRYLSRISRQHLNLDIFDTGTLTPVARSGLGVSIAFIGGISLSLVFQTQEDLLSWNNITVWILLVCFAVILFFLSIWSTHNILAGAKRRELSLARDYLVKVTRDLRESAIQGTVEGKDSLYTAVSAWGIYERRVREVPEWPFNAGILRRLFASVLVPGVVYLLKVLLIPRTGF